MKKFFASAVVVLTIIIGGNLAVATATHAATPAVSVETAKSVTEIAPAVIGGGVIKPLRSLSWCYMAIDWHTWCYQTNCTYFEQVALGCRNNTWVRTTTYWWA